MDNLNSPNKTRHTVNDTKEYFKDDKNFGEKKHNQIHNNDKIFRKFSEKDMDEKSTNKKYSHPESNWNNNYSKYHLYSNSNEKDKDKEIRRLKKIIRNKDSTIRTREIENRYLKNELEKLKSKARKKSLGVHSNSSNIVIVDEEVENLVSDQENNISSYNNIDPDRMTYEELLELQDKIGYVSKGFNDKEIRLSPKIKYSRNKAKCKKLDELCTVCQYCFNSDEDLRFLNCNHSFHTECVDHWFRKEKICPNCKEEVILEKKDKN